jgi:serine/threonine-protein kinase
VFEGKTAIDVCAQHMHREPTPPSQLTPVPAELEAILLRCLAKRPAERYASANALAAALGELVLDKAWDEDEARRWWRDFEALGDQPVAVDPAARTIPIDLGEREEERA